MNVIANRLSAIFLAIATLQCAEVRAQLRTPPTVRTPQKGLRPSPPPNVLYQQLTSPEPSSQFSETEQRVDALDVLGIGGSEFQEMRLTYQDLDGDGIPEALFTIQADNQGSVSLVVLKRKGSQWYALASPEEFSCRCKYDDSPLDTFAEVRPWGYDKNEPARLLFVRPSGGGTDGGYNRELFVYALQGFELKRAFHVTEEERGCTPENTVSKCDLGHVDVRTVDETGQPQSLLSLRYQRKGSGGDFWHDTWWIGVPIQACQAHTWNAQRQQFLENRKATSAYCSHLGRQLSQAVTR